MGRCFRVLASCLVLASCSSRASFGDFDASPSADAAASTDTSAAEVATDDVAAPDAGTPTDTPAIDVAPAVDVVDDAGASPDVGSPDVPPLDAPLPDVAPPADVVDVVDASPPTDAPAADAGDGALTCRSSRECSTLSLVCDTTRMRCVECVVDLDCPTGQVCGTDAVCRAPACTVGAPTCASETRVRTCDPRSGFVEMACPSGAVCTAGVCQTRACTPNAVDCASATERRVCNASGTGATTTACPGAANASGRCTGGACGTTCNPGYADCDGSAANGCEADTRSDPSNCGACRSTCATGTSCSGGACLCAAGLDICGGRCVNLQTDTTNCGACGRACPAGVACTAGVCIVDPCGGGLSSCGGRCVDTRTDAANCGGCGLACASAGTGTASVMCLSSACAMTCSGSNYDVDGSTTNGCEVADDTLAGHTQATATARPSQGCSDTTTGTISGAHIVSDARTHVPSPSGFSATVGSAPDWYSIRATGGTLCANNYGITVTTSGGSSTGNCYQVTFITDRTTVSMSVSGSGGNTMSSGAFGLYTENTTVYLRVEKICSTATREDVSYSLSYHL